MAAKAHAHMVTEQHQGGWMRGGGGWGATTQAGAAPLAARVRVGAIWENITFNVFPFSSRCARIARRRSRRRHTRQYTLRPYLFAIGSHIPPGAECKCILSLLVISLPQQKRTNPASSQTRPRKLPTWAPDVRRQSN